MKTLILLLFTLNLSGQTIFTEDVRQILMFQDTRTLGENNKLLTYLNSDSEDLVIRTLNALANIADTNTIDEIGRTLLNAARLRREVKEYSAFALGQMPGEKSAEYLKRALSNEPNANVICALLNALGRAGDEEDLNFVSNFQTENESVKACIVMSIARFGIRKIKNDPPEAGDKLKQEINEASAKNIAYAFNRIGDENFLNKYLLTITELTRSSDAETRMWALSALGKTKNKNYIDTLLSALSVEKDWRVKINILNSLSYFDFKIPDASPILTQIDSDNESVSLKAIEVLGKIFAGSNSNEPGNKLRNIFGSSKTNLTVAAASALAEIFKDKMKDDFLKVYNRTSDWDIKAGIIRAFGKFSNGNIYKTVRKLITDDVQRYSEKYPGATNTISGNNDMLKLYRAFVEMLTEIDDKVSPSKGEDLNTIRLIYSEFLGSKDPLLVDMTLTSLMEPMYNKYREETRKIIMFDYDELKLPDGSDAMQLLIQAMGGLKMTEAAELLTKNLKSENYDIAKSSVDALEKITGKNYEQEITAPKYRTDFDWDYIADMKKYVTLITNQGEIKLELFPDAAPFTVQNFLKLSENHFYDSTIFHRVVPNFVIQGGDPSATGYSGPGYSIRSEFSPLTYETGYLGMASSGKDTEGSQFFITHSPQPHLDARYTIFGKVIDGMDVVDKIQVGDVLLAIR